MSQENTNTNTGGNQGQGIIGSITKTVDDTLTGGKEQGGQGGLLGGASNILGQVGKTASSATSNAVNTVGGAADSVTKGASNTLSSVTGSGQSNNTTNQNQGGS